MLDPAHAVQIRQHKPTNAITRVAERNKAKLDEKAQYIHGSETMSYHLKSKIYRNKNQKEEKVNTRSNKKCWKITGKNNEVNIENMQYDVLRMLPLKRLRLLWGAHADSCKRQLLSWCILLTFGRSVCKSYGPACADKCETNMKSEQIACESSYISYLQQDK